MHTYCCCLTLLLLLSHPRPGDSSCTITAQQVCIYCLVCSSFGALQHAISGGSSTGCWEPFIGQLGAFQCATMDRNLSCRRLSFIAQCLNQKGWQWCCMQFIGCPWLVKHTNCRLGLQLHTRFNLDDVICRHRGVGKCSHQYIQRPEQEAHIPCRTAGCSAADVRGLLLGS